MSVLAATPAFAQQTADTPALALQSPPTPQPPPATLPQTTSPPATPPQTTTPPPAGPTTPANGQTGDDKTPPPDATSKDRLFFFLPNYLTVQGAKDATPLTTHQKFAVVAQGSFDIVEFPWYAVLAGISQANNSDPGYGSGWSGYGKRYAAAFADGTIENFSVGAVFPTLFHEDPRYFEMGHGGFLKRAGYAVSRTVVARTDSGRERVNLSEIIGSAAAAGISNTYAPAGSRTFTNALSTWRTMLTYDTLTTVMKEFWPDLRKIF